MQDRPNLPLFLLTAAILVLSALLMQPLFTAIVGAITFAVALQHPYDWLSARIRNRSLCATVALILVIAAIILPCALLVQQLIPQAIGAVAALQHQTSSQHLNDLADRHPAFAGRLQTLTDGIDPDDAIRSAALFLGRQLAVFLGHSISLFVQIIFLLFLLFFLFRDRELFLAYLYKLLPLRDDESSLLISRIDDTIKATALGRLAIAMIQGILAGLAYWLLDVPGYILWAFTTCVGSMIPGVGAVLVWAPIAAYLGLTGHWGKAAILAVWGGLVVSLIDNILYPILVGPRLRAHPVAIFVSIIGGAAVFGVPGIVLGPIVFTAADTLLAIHRARRAQPAS
ncbi:MAG TPA: AI-2E family transporter [Granulicella sp.]